MKTLLASAAVLAALSGAALASSPVPGVSAGDAQLALTAGVEPGRYSRAELIQIIEAKRENDAGAVQYFLSGANRASAVGNDSAGAVQLALTAGVEPGVYSVPELIQIIEAKRENDAERLNFILSGANREGERAGVSPGKAQLAASLGLNPADYTLAELVLLTSDND